MQRVVPACRWQSIGMQVAINAACGAGMQVAINRQRVAGLLQRAADDLPAQAAQTQHRKQLEADIRTYIQVSCTASCWLVQACTDARTLMVVHAHGY